MKNSYEFTKRGDTKEIVMNIVIRNLRNSKPSKPWHIRVDRQSIFGNPYPMRSEADRDRVCEWYEAYFTSSIIGNPNFVRGLEELHRIYMRYGKLELYCWCAPKRCHAETIVRHLKHMQELEQGAGK